MAAPLSRMPFVVENATNSRLRNVNRRERPTVRAGVRMPFVPENAGNNAAFVAGPAGSGAVPAGSGAVRAGVRMPFVPENAAAGGAGAGPAGSGAGPAGSGAARAGDIVPGMPYVVENAGNNAGAAPAPGGAGALPISRINALVNILTADFLIYKTPGVNASIESLRAGHATNQVDDLVRLYNFYSQMAKHRRRASGVNERALFYTIMIVDILRTVGAADERIPLIRVDLMRKFPLRDYAEEYSIARSLLVNAQRGELPFGVDQNTFVAPDPVPGAGAGAGARGGKRRRQTRRKTLRRRHRTRRG